MYSGTWTNNEGTYTITCIAGYDSCAATLEFDEENGIVTITIQDPSWGETIYTFYVNSSDPFVGEYRDDADDFPYMTLSVSGTGSYVIKEVSYEGEDTFYTGTWTNVDGVYTITCYDVDSTVCEATLEFDGEEVTITIQDPIYDEIIYTFYKQN